MKETRKKRVRRKKEGWTYEPLHESLVWPRHPVRCAPCEELTESTRTSLRRNRKRENHGLIFSWSTNYQKPKAFKCTETSVALAQFIVWWSADRHNRSCRFVWLGQTV
jgi:hypothetical protein